MKRVLITIVLFTLVGYSSAGTSDVSGKTRSKIEALLTKKIPIEANDISRTNHRGDATYQLTTLKIDYINRVEALGMVIYAVQGQWTGIETINKDWEYKPGKIVRKGTSGPFSARWFRCELQENLYGDLALQGSIKFFKNKPGQD